MVVITNDGRDNQAQTIDLVESLGQHGPTQDATPRLTNQREALIWDHVVDKGQHNCKDIVLVAQPSWGGRSAMTRQIEIDAPPVSTIDKGWFQIIEDVTIVHSGTMQHQDRPTLSDGFVMHG